MSLYYIISLSRSCDIALELEENEYEYKSVRLQNKEQLVLKNTKLNQKKYWN